jgi:phage-related protein
MTDLPLADQIHVSSQKTVQHRTRIAQFGDGYSQRVADGLNSRVENWQFVWAGLTESDYQTLTDALDAGGAVTPYTYTPPGSSSAKTYAMTADGYTVQHHGADLYSVSANFKQVF